MPFWLFSMLAESVWSARIGEYWYRTETYTTTDKDGKTVTRTRTVRETEWWPLDGRHHRYYTGYLVSASRGLSQAEVEQVRPFHLAALQRYQAYFLAGWSCEEYSVARSPATETAHTAFTTREQQHIAAFLPGDTYSGLHVDTQLTHVDADLVLLPVYLLRYQYRDKQYRFIINGQTGRIVGQKPLSPWRVGILVAVIVVVVVLGALWAAWQS